VDKFLGALIASGRAYRFWAQFLSIFDSDRAEIEILHPEGIAAPRSSNCTEKAGNGPQSGGPASPAPACPAARSVAVPLVGIERVRTVLIGARNRKAGAAQQTPPEQWPSPRT
jgi:hypothetical protein